MRVRVAKTVLWALVGASLVALAATLVLAGDSATMAASRRTDSPAERITMISLPAASAPSPSSDPIRTATGSISKARFGRRSSVYRITCGVW